MKLVQKLPIGLGIVCMMLSSCSKEDVQTPEPQAGSVNEHSGLKANLDVVTSLPFLPPTNDGIVNYDSYPRNWERGVNVPDNIIAYPTGTSSLTSLWGQWYAENQWIKALPPVTSSLAAKSMLTTTSYTSVAAETNKRSSVFATIQNLKPGKTYSATFYVASTINSRIQGENTKPAYAKSAEIRVFPYANGGEVKLIVDLAGKQAEWVKKTITFTPTKTTAKFAFSGLTQQGNVYSYIHLAVDPNSISEVDPRK